MATGYGRKICLHLEPHRGDRRPGYQPQGFSEKLSWDFKTPVVKNFTLQDDATVV